MAEHHAREQPAMECRAINAAKVPKPAGGYAQALEVSQGTFGSPIRER